MRKSWLLKLLPSLLLALLAGTALAGGVVVSLDQAVGDISAGSAFDVNFTILSAHDGSPQDGFHPIVLATHPGTGDILSFNATPREEPGRYTASVTLPVEGEWAWRIVPESYYPENLIAEMTPIQVGVVATPVSRATPAAVPAIAWVSAAVVSVAALGLVLVGLRRRLIPAT